MFRDPPSSVTGPLAQYLRDVSRALTALPHVSFFSGTDPNSLVTGTTGHLAINLGSASTSSRLWLNASAPSSTATQLGWVVVRIAT